MEFLLNWTTVLFITFHGQTADMELHKWFEGLSSPTGGYCCAETDGIKIDDPDWGHDAQGYWVVLSGEKVRVPPGALISKRHAKVKYAVVWRQFLDGRPAIRCFLPGVES